MSIKNIAVNGLILALCMVVFGIDWPVYNDSQVLGFVIALGLFSVGSFMLAVVAIVLPLLVGLVIAAIAIDDTKAAACLTVGVALIWSIVVGTIYEVWALTGGMTRFFDQFPVFTIWQAIVFSIISTTVILFTSFGNKKSS